MFFVFKGTDENEIRMSHFKFILQKCELEKEYPNGIKVSDVVALDLEEDDEDSKRIMSYKDLPWKLLRGLLNVNCDARDRKVDLNTTKETSTDISKIDDTNNDNEDISPLDIFHVVFQCCDAMLQQLLFQKLFLCKQAVPFIYIRHTDSSPVTSVWPLRSLKMTSQIETNNETVSEIGVLEVPTNVVSVARIGRPEFSKSALINGLLFDTENKIFFNHTCNMGKVNHTLSEGSVDMFWLSVVPKGQIFEKPITFLNIRGDFKRSHYDRVREFALGVSDCFLFVVDIGTIMNGTTSFQRFLKHFIHRRIILVIVGSILDKNKQFLKNLNVEWEKSDIRLVFTHNINGINNIREIANDLSQKLKEQLDCLETKSLENRISSLDVIKTDENNDNCEKGKECANDLFTLLKDINEIRQFKLAITPIFLSYSDKLGKEIKTFHRAMDEENREKSESAVKQIRQDQLNHVSAFIVRFLKCFTKLDENPLRI